MKMRAKKLLILLVRFLKKLFLRVDAHQVLILLQQRGVMKIFKPGDEIVMTELEHHANLLPWQRLAQKKGAVLKFIPLFPDGTVDLSCLDSIITNKTKMVSVIHVSNAIGTHVDIVTIIARARAVGARVLIDAAQSAPHQKINVHAMDCDFLVFSGHKMLGPTGIGVLYIKKELHDADSTV